MSNIITINKIATINYYEFDKDYSHIGESHNFWEMVYADKGELYVMAKDKEYQLKQGEAFFTSRTNGIPSAAIIQPRPMYLLLLLSAIPAQWIFSKIKK